MQKLFVITRADLTPAQQAVQAVHAALTFARDWTGTFVTDRLDEAPLVLCAAPDELTLCWLIEEARRTHITLSAFYEPDLDGALTAVCLEPAGRRLAAHYPLALQGD